MMKGMGEGMALEQAACPGRPLCHILLLTLKKNLTS